MEARTPEEVQERPARRFDSLLPLSAGHAYASLADARSSFGDNGEGGDGAPQRLISAWSSLRSTISRRTQAQAIKEVVAWQLAEAMKQKNISKNKMATLLKTSRTQVDGCSTRKTTSRSAACNGPPQWSGTA